MDRAGWPTNFKTTSISLVKRRKALYKDKRKYSNLNQKYLEFFFT